ncbi:MAG TPA: M1 family aminopeptidase, partial [Thermoanaerobaculia bacterium]|nr:M1 family aminopeptidase [Thermoanaerobaculia bacterium]
MDPVRQLQDGLEDPLYQGFFAGWFEGVEIGKVLYAVEPDSQEQVSLGKFVPAYLNAQERKRAERRLDREQRRGRRLGVEVEHLGSWDTWLSTSLRSKGGEVTPGFSPFEPRRYQIDLSLDDALEATGKARVELEAMSSQARFLRLKLNPDLRVDSVLDARGEPLFFLQNTAEVLVVLPQALAAGDHTVVEVQYQGRLFEKADTGDYAILDSINWHPHAGTIDRAAFDVTFHWPARLELAASGKLVAGGQEKGGRKWQRRTVERPSSAFGFELGRFSFKTRKVGHVEITLALSPVYYAARDSWHRLVLDGAAEALEYFEQIYGPYPFDELTVATSPRGYSQSLVGFVSVSRSMMGEGTNSLLGLVFGFEDPRTILAHEVAHQWWGHVVGWESYRDQWLSEAMANYSAMLFARERLKDQLRWGIGPASRWQENLSAPTRDGRPREAIGPLVLGERLSSTRSESAYQAIVYQKGALVLNTLAQQLSVDRFKKGLAELIRVVDNREISTANFFELLGRITAEDLAGFEQRFVRGTGLPDLTYTYRFEPTADGHWQVIGHTEQRVVRLLRYRLRRRAG